jgi:hypothetical protein
MTRASRGAWRRARRRRGLTMAEAVMSMMVVSLMVVSALNTVGARAVNRRLVADRELGMFLANELMSEILAQAYREGPGVTTLGRDAGELAGVRTNWDDVDDYDGFSESSPKHRDGSAFSLSDPAAWNVSVQTRYVSRTGYAFLPALAEVDTGIKRITVTVSHREVRVATLTALRTSTWESPK